MSRKLFIAAVAVTAVLVGAGTLQGPATVAEVRGAPATSLEASAGLAPARADRFELIGVLREWDRRRADAWAQGNPALLRPLYTRGSRAGKRDRAMLGAWRDRGLVVRDLQTQLLAVRELSRSATTWTLLVTDRVAGGVAAGQEVARRLPRDEPTTRTVRLRLVDGRWRVAAVKPRPVRSGSRR